jgi:mevalonate kinase
MAARRISTAGVFNADCDVRSSIGGTAPAWWTLADACCTSRLAERAGYEITIRSTIPMGAGLASSAALVVAGVGAVNLAHGETISGRELANEAWRVEDLVSAGNTGPMDQMVCAVGGCLAVRWDGVSAEMSRTGQLPPSDLVIADSRVQHNTAEVIAWKRARRRANDPSIQRYARQTAQIVEDELLALAANDLREFGRLVTAAHRLLSEEMASSTPLIDACVDRMVANGAIGAKLSGTGKGGCVVAIAEPGDGPRLAQCLADLPVNVFFTALTSVGFAPGSSDTR